MSFPTSVNLIVRRQRLWSRTISFGRWSQSQAANWGGWWWLHFVICNLVNGSGWYVYTYLYLYIYIFILIIFGACSFQCGCLCLCITHLPVMVVLCCHEVANMFDLGGKRLIRLILAGTCEATSIGMDSMATGQSARVILGIDGWMDR